MLPHHAPAWRQPFLKFPFRFCSYRANPSSANINPQRGHKVPIPGRNVNGDSASLQRLVQQGSARCPDQRNHSSGQVNRVRDGQQKCERTARIRIHVESPSCSLPQAIHWPTRNANPKITVTPSHGISFFAKRNPGNRLHRRQRRLPRRIPARELHGDAAGQQHSRVDRQQQPGQIHSPQSRT